MMMSVPRSALFLCLLSACSIPLVVGASSSDGHSEEMSKATSPAEERRFLRQSQNHRILNPARRVKTVFISSRNYNPADDIGSASNADSLCQGLADDAGLDGTYMAWFSDASSSPSTRFTRSPGRYETTGGEAVGENVIAYGWKDLTDDNGPQNAITYTENGDRITANGVWTGTNANGKKGGADCNGWTVGDVSSVGRVGTNEDLSLPSSPLRWTRNGSFSCGRPFPIYCFEQ